jgi:GDP-4-dehydro-6-deoxy-D-mannose reductase
MMLIIFIFTGIIKQNKKILIFLGMKGTTIMEKIFVLGGSGFVGNNFLILLSNLDHSKFSEIISLDIALPSKCVDKVKYIICDIADKKALEDTLLEHKPKFLINFAGILRADNLSEMLRINLSPSDTVMDFASNNGYPKRIVLIGSAAEYGIPKNNPVKEDDTLCPINIYGISKMFQTKLAQYYFRTKSVGVIIARTFNLIGIGVSTSLAIGNWMSQIDVLEDGQTIKVGNLESQRDYLDVNEASNKYLNLLERGEAGEVYNICSGTPIKMQVVLESLIKSKGKKLKIEVVNELVKKDEINVIYGCNKKYESIDLRNGSGF